MDKKTANCSGKLTLRATRLAPGATALSIGLPALLLGSLPLANMAMADDTIMLDTMQVEERTVDPIHTPSLALHIKLKSLAIAVMSKILLRRHKQ